MIRAFWQVALISAAMGCLEFPLALSAQEPQGLGDPGKPVALELQAVDSEPQHVGQPATITGRNDRLQLILTARFESGQVRDWTRQVQYSTQPEGILRIDEKGLATPLADGTTTVTATGPENLTASVQITISNYANPPQVNFPNQVVPVFTKLGCNGGGCHGKSGGQNGFPLSLLGFEAKEDYQYLVKEARGRRLFPSDPDHSLLLLKVSGGLPHGGGVRMTPDSDDYAILRLWIEQGMPFGQPEDPVLESVSVFPQMRMMSRDGEQQLKVLAHYSNGLIRDVTRQAQYEPNIKEMAEIEGAGLVKLKGLPGDFAVMVRFQGQVTAFRATAPLGAPIAQLPPERTIVDHHVFNKLKQLGLPPSEICDDATFIRRVTIDIAGRLPTLEETQAFLADASPDKRDKLIDRLLDSNDFAEYFAQKWSAILRNKVEQNQSRSGNFLFHDWIRTSLRENKPYDQFVRELVTASGDVNRNPAVNWMKHVRTVDEKVEDTAQVFLGLRIQCARCHHHPFEKWSQHDYWSLAAFYTNVRDKNSNQFIYVQRGVPRANNPKTNESLLPAALGAEPLTDLTPDDDARQFLARWMTDPQNPYLSRALANRYWKHFLGRGIVDPEDDMRETNPPSNPELLQALAEHFVQSGFDQKELIRTICRSSTYQLSAVPNQYNAMDQQSFSRFQPRRLNAEVLLDGLDEVLGTTSNFNSLPRGIRAVQIPDHGGVDNFFLNVFGRPAGGSACECERTSEMSMAQCLQLLNSDDVHGKLEQSRARKLVEDQERDDAAKITELCFRAWSRPPKEEELKAYLDYIGTFEPNQKAQAYQDILWTLMNTKEFLFNH